MPRLLPPRAPAPARRTAALCKATHPAAPPPQLASAPACATAQTQPGHLQPVTPVAARPQQGVRARSCARRLMPSPCLACRAASATGLTCPGQLPALVRALATRAAGGGLSARGLLPTRRPRAPAGTAPPACARCLPVPLTAPACRCHQHTARIAAGSCGLVTAPLPAATPPTRHSCHQWRPLCCVL